MAVRVGRPILWARKTAFHPNERNHSLPDISYPLVASRKTGNMKEWKRKHGLAARSSPLILRWFTANPYLWGRECPLRPRLRITMPFENCRAWARNRRFRRRWTAFQPFLARRVCVRSWPTRQRTSPSFSLEGRTRRRRTGAVGRPSTWTRCPECAAVGMEGHQKRQAVRSDSGGKVSGICHKRQAHGGRARTPASAVCRPHPERL
jgi:hypothetical protein